MDGEIDAPVEQSLIELFGEEPFAASLDQAAILDAIAAGDDGDDFECVRRDAEFVRQSRACLLGLRQRKLRAARADAEEWRHVLHLPASAMEGNAPNDAAMKPLTVLGIESSCDETAAAVLRLDEAGPRVLSDVVLGQTAHHAPYKGVVPEIAARAHVEGLDGTIAAAMRDAGLGFADLDGVAATAGPGVLGGVVSMAGECRTRSMKRHVASPRLRL